MIITKYSASGNTFVIFHTNIKDDYSSLAIELCKKENVDGLIVVIPHEIYDFEWLFYNSDGSTASMCGNGTRAVAHYAFTNKLASTNVKFLTGAGVITCVVDDDIVETTMPKPSVMKNEFEELGYRWIIIDTGVPHLVTLVDDLTQFNLDICSKMRYKYNANVNFAKVENGDLKVRTYERGVESETQACGTGMTACFLQALELNLISSPANVYPTSGELLVLKKDKNGIYFKGKVIKIEEKKYNDF
ncbi:MAG: diaminopimelate epimerase [Arcobacter sp.]|nr:MAG: diaminopimelate epimerase [Arcobacter sp.]